MFRAGEKNRFINLAVVAPICDNIRLNHFESLWVNKKKFAESHLERIWLLTWDKTCPIVFAPNLNVSAWLNPLNATFVPS